MSVLGNLLNYKSVHLTVEVSAVFHGPFAGSIKIFFKSFEKDSGKHPQG